MERERWCEGEWGDAEDEKKTLLLTLEEFLLLSSGDIRILRSDSSFAFTGLQTNGRVNLRRVTDF